MSRIPYLTGRQMAEFEMAERRRRVENADRRARDKRVALGMQYRFDKADKQREVVKKWLPGVELPSAREGLLLYEGLDKALREAPEGSDKKKIADEFIKDALAQDIAQRARLMGQEEAATGLPAGEYTEVYAKGVDPKTFAAVQGAQAGAPTLGPPTDPGTDFEATPGTTTGVSREEENAKFDARVKAGLASQDFDQRVTKPELNKARALVEAKEKGDVTTAARFRDMLSGDPAFTAQLPALDQGSNQTPDASVFQGMFNDGDRTSDTGQRTTTDIPAMAEAESPDAMEVARTAVGDLFSRGTEGDYPQFGLDEEEATIGDYTQAEAEPSREYEALKSEFDTLDRAAQDEKTEYERTASLRKTLDNMGLGELRLDDATAKAQELARIEAERRARAENDPEVLAARKMRAETKLVQQKIKESQAKIEELESKGSSEAELRRARATLYNAQAEELGRKAEAMKDKDSVEFKIAKAKAQKAEAEAVRQEILLEVAKAEQEGSMTPKQRRELNKANVEIAKQRAARMKALAKLAETPAQKGTLKALNDVASILDKVNSAAFRTDAAKVDIEGLESKLEAAEAKVKEATDKWYWSNASEDAAAKPFREEANEIKAELDLARLELDQRKKHLKKMRGLAEQADEAATGGESPAPSAPRATGDKPSPPAATTK